jgi:hypothetical protein
LTCPAGQEPNSAKIGCISCENGKYSNSNSGNVCATCPAGHELNGKIDCVECAIGKYSNSSSNNMCTKCPDGQEPNSNKDDCIECDIGLFSSPLKKVLCTTCESIEDLDLCESVKGPSSEECLWLESNESKSEGHCVVKVWCIFTIFKSYFLLFFFCFFFLVCFKISLIVCYCFFFL